LAILSFTPGYVLSNIALWKSKCALKSVLLYVLLYLSDFSIGSFIYIAIILYSPELNQMTRFAD